MPNWLENTLYFIGGMFIILLISFISGYILMKEDEKDMDGE